MKVLKSIVLTIFFTISLVAQAVSEQRGSSQEAQAMAERAADLIRSEGIEAAKLAFHDKKNSNWHDRDLYVFAYDETGTNLVHGAKETLIGKNLMQLKDATGFAIIRDGVLKVEDVGWVDYQWQNPVNKKVEHKSSYVIALDGKIFVGVGAYK